MVVFLGISGQGKSTVLNYILGNELIEDLENGSLLSKRKDNNPFTEVIGLKDSDTLFPIFLKCDFLTDTEYLLDTPGI